MYAQYNTNMKCEINQITYIHTTDIGRQAVGIRI